MDATVVHPLYYMVIHTRHGLLGTFLENFETMNIGRDELVKNW